MCSAFLCLELDTISLHAESTNERNPSNTRSGSWRTPKGSSLGSSGSDGEETRAAIKGVPRQIAQASGSDKWSVSEIVAHLADTEVALAFVCG